MVRIFSVSVSSVPSMACRARSTNASELGAMGGEAMGIWVIHGWRSSWSRWITDHSRRRARHPSPVSTRVSAPCALPFHMSWSSSSLLVTYR